MGQHAEIGEESSTPQGEVNAQQAAGAGCRAASGVVDGVDGIVPNGNPIPHTHAQPPLPASKTQTVQQRPQAWAMTNTMQEWLGWDKPGVHARTHNKGGTRTRWSGMPAFSPNSSSTSTTYTGWKAVGPSLFAQKKFMVASMVARTEGGLGSKRGRRVAGTRVGSRSERIGGKKGGGGR